MSLLNVVAGELGELLIILKAWTKTLRILVSFLGLGSILY